MYRIDRVEEHTVKFKPRRDPEKVRLQDLPVLNGVGAAVRFMFVCIS